MNWFTNAIRWLFAKKPPVQYAPEPTTPIAPAPDPSDLRAMAAEMSASMHIQPPEPWPRPSETVHPQEKSMAYVPKYPPVRQAVAPSAILMLRGFKSYAALAQNFLDIPDEATKYRYWKETPAIHPLQDYLGISAGWINALDYDGLADGVLIQQTHFDKATGHLIVNGQPSEHPVLSWATGDGSAPPNYRPLSHVDGSGADLLAAFLHAATQSAYLKSLGLTDEAIAAARA